MNFAKSQVLIEFTFIWLNKLKFIGRRKFDFLLYNMYFVGSYTQPLGAAPLALPPATLLHSIQEFIHEATVLYSHKKQIRHAVSFLPLRSLHIMIK